MNDHLIDVSGERHGPSLEALTAMAALVHRVPGQVGRARRAVRDVPPPGRPGQGRHGPGSRHRRALHRRSGRRLARGRARAVRDPDAADAGTLRPLRIGRARAPGAVVRGGRGAARRDPPGPVLPARRGDQRTAAADPGRAAAVARRAEAARASRWPPRSPMAGRCPTVVALGQPSRPRATSARSARRSWPPSRRSAATRRRSRSAPRSRPGRPREDRRWALGQGLRGRRARRDPRHPRHAGRTSGAAGVDAVAREVAEPLRDAIG